jgi:hypothetical protein
LSVVCAAHAGAQPALVTLAEGTPKVLRGATWYKLVPGTALEEADIVTVGPKQQMQIETASGSIVNATGEATIVVTLAKDGALTLTLPAGFAKTAAKMPPVRLRTPQFDVIAGDAIVVRMPTPRSSSSRPATRSSSTPQARSAMPSAANTGSGRATRSRPGRSRRRRSSTHCRATTSIPCRRWHRG